MSETLVVAEPGGWLAEYQRAHCKGATAFDTFQGCVADEIVLPQSAHDHADPAQLVLACNAWTDAMLRQIYFIPGEFAPEALTSYYAHDYWTQVKAGGHAQYFAVRGRDEIALKCAAAGLKSMVADPHAELFNLLVRLKKLPKPGARKLAAQKGYRDVATAIRDLDKRFEALELKEPLMPRQKTWLKSLRKLKIAPDTEMMAALGRMASLNALRAQRLAEAQAIRAEHERDDPAYRSVKELCEMAGLSFAGLAPGGFAKMRSVWPEGPDCTAFVVRVETQRGPRSAAYYCEGGLFKNRLAVLLEPGNALPIGSLKISKVDYAAIVPAVKR